MINHQKKLWTVVKEHSMGKSAMVSDNLIDVLKYLEFIPGYILTREGKKHTKSVTEVLHYIDIGIGSFTQDEGFDFVDTLTKSVITVRIQFGENDSSKFTLIDYKDVDSYTKEGTILYQRYFASGIFEPAKVLSSAEDSKITGGIWLKLYNLVSLLEEKILVNSHWDYPNKLLYLEKVGCLGIDSITTVEDII